MSADEADRVIIRLLAALVRLQLVKSGADVRAAENEARAAVYDADTLRA